MKAQKQLKLFLLLFSSIFPESIWPVKEFKWKIRVFPAIFPLVLCPVSWPFGYLYNLLKKDLLNDLRILKPLPKTDDINEIKAAVTK